MKHLILFENYTGKVQNQSEDLFEFFPFKNAKEKISKFGLPEKISLIDLSESNPQIPDSSWQPETGIGIFIMHRKNTNGLGRAIVRSLNPLTFDIAFFDQDFKKIVEQVGISRETVSEIYKKPQSFKFFSDLRDNFPDIFNFLKGKNTKADLAADAGELYF